MKSIVSINTAMPEIEYLDYYSGESLRDFDIAIFDPSWGHFNRVQFSGGGSCITIEDTQTLKKAMAHWSLEIRDALRAGKTIFIMLNHYQTDLAADSCTTVKTQRTYNTSYVNNYQAVPGALPLSSSKGRKVVVKDNAFKRLHETLSDMLHYRVIVQSPTREVTFATKDGSPIGAISRFKDLPGSLVYLPYFDFSDDSFSNENDEDDDGWSTKAIKTSKALISQLVAIDKYVKSSIEQSPAPEWVAMQAIPAPVASINQQIDDLDSRLAELQRERDAKIAERAAILEFTHLLYETGKPLERAIEKALQLIGYSVQSLRIGDLEIDHVIEGPSGKRMIGESEGKDTSAIDITKFRQLESNIGEDFQRDEIDEPAKGLLFGNGYRLTPPSERSEQFTQKCLTNAKRLSSALIRTPDLYGAVTYLLDNPDDETFKLACRSAIEDTIGGIAEFPTG